MLFCDIVSYIVYKKVYPLDIPDYKLREEVLMILFRRMNMELLNELLNNKILISAASGWIVAQVLKTLIYTFFTKKFVAERLVGGGGMPSSHSATVCALSTATFLQFGVSSFEFAVTAILSLIVMYDAIGVRQEAGKQAKVLNDMIEIFLHMGKDMDIEKQLKEFIGHTPLQVFVGALLGIATACFIVL